MTIGAPLTPPPGRIASFHDGHALLDATAATLSLAGLAMFATCPRVGSTEGWRAVVNRIEAVEESCRRRLPIGGADYIDSFEAELRDLLNHVPIRERSMLYAALAMLPALRISMSDSDSKENSTP